MKRFTFLVAIVLILCLTNFVFANQPSSESVLKNPSLTLEKANTEAKVRLSKTYGKLPPRLETDLKQLFQFDPQWEKKIRSLPKRTSFSYGLKLVPRPA